MNKEKVSKKDMCNPIQETKVCMYCFRKYNKVYYPPICESCGASLEWGIKNKRSI